MCLAGSSCTLILLLHPLLMNTYPEDNSNTSHLMQRQIELNKYQLSNTCTTTARELPIRTSTFQRDKARKQLRMGPLTLLNMSPADTECNTIEQKLSFG